MLDVKSIVKIISDLGIKSYAFNYNIYNDYINKMYKWYRGYDASFHTFKQYNGNSNVTVQKARLCMAKRVCEDYASIMCNENLNFYFENKEIKELLLGFDEQGGILGNNDFWNLSAKLTEITCALGTGAFEIVVDGLLNVNNNIISDETTKIKVISHSAPYIIPLSWDNTGKITEVCFIDQYKIKDDDFIDLRMHVLENGQYTIYNKRVKVVGTSANFTYMAIDNTSILEKFETKSNIPWFTILKFPIINNYDLSSPMGASIYGNSIDILKNVDDAFNILSNEYKNGNKKVFYSKSMLNRDKQGNPIVPDDINKTVFYYTGDDYETGADGSKELVHEFNPSLRINDITSGLQSALNYLSVSVGLGNNYYHFEGGSIQKTATEVISENSSMWRTITKNECALKSCYIELFKSVVYANNLVFNTKYDLNIKVGVAFDASIIEDKTSIRNRDLEEVRLGIMTIEEYRSKYYKNVRRDSVENI